MIMTNEEIVREYRQAKAPMKQIGILADENQCTKKEIVAILLEAGETVPKNFLNKPPAPKEAEDDEADYGPILPAPAAASAKAELYAGQVARAAVDAIARLQRELGKNDESDCWSFVDQVKGVLMLAHALTGEVEQA